MNVNTNNLTGEKLADEFRLEFNALDNALKKETGLFEPHTKSLRRVQEVIKKNGGWRSKIPVFRLINDNRNFIVHTPTKEYFLAATPTEKIVDELKWLREGNENPERVSPRFTGEMANFGLDQPLTDLLEPVQNYQYSFFPIIENGRCIGLIQEMAFYSGWRAGPEARVTHLLT